MIIIDNWLLASHSARLIVEIIILVHTAGYSYTPDNVANETAYVLISKRGYTISFIN